MEQCSHSQLMTAEIDDSCEANYIRNNARGIGTSAVGNEALANAPLRMMYIYSVGMRARNMLHDNVSAYQKYTCGQYHQNTVRIGEISLSTRLKYTVEILRLIEYLDTE